MGRAGGERRVQLVRWVNADMERWWRDFLDRQSGGVWDILSGLGGSGLVRVRGGDGISEVIGGGWPGWARWCGWFGRQGVVWRVEYFRHLAVDGAVDVVAEGGMGVLAVKGLGLVFCLALAFLTVLTSELRSGWSEGVVVDIPSGWW